MTMEHKSTFLADQVFEKLETDILAGEYKSGEILTELGLSAVLGVSRTPIREAVRRLEQEGLVEILPKGIKVLGLTSKDLEDIYIVRMNLEGIAVEMAAKNITPEQLKELDEAVSLQEYYLSRKDADHIEILDGRFHELLFIYSGSAVIYKTLKPLHNKVKKYRRVSVENNYRAEHSVKEHRDIYNAIARGDIDSAVAATLTHIENAMKSIITKG